MVDIVVGCGFGDEGKGQTVNDLVHSRYDLVVRYNGGQQAGHTVVHNGKRHVFSNFCAGTLQHHVMTYWSKYCTVYPGAANVEWNKLWKDFDIRARSHVDRLAMVTTPWDVFANRNGVETDHGTCGSGFGRTVLRHETLDHSFRLFAFEMENRWILREKAIQIAKFYDQDPEEMLDAFIAECERYLEYSTITEEKYIQNFDHVIFEGAQGVLLDRNHGIFPHVTRSNTTCKNAIEICQRQGLENIVIHHVTRAYLTRHGNGPMPTPEGMVVNHPEETNVTNDWQGAFRIAPLDMNLLHHARKADSIYHPEIVACPLTVTCLDHIMEDSVPVYQHGQLITIDKPDFIEYVKKYSQI